MIPILLRRELRIRLILNPVAEDRRLALELATLVFGVDPVEDRTFLVLRRAHAGVSITRRMGTNGACWDGGREMAESLTIVLEIGLRV
jgi:hypothetical protein